MGSPREWASVAGAVSLLLLAGCQGLFGSNPNPPQPDEPAVVGITADDQIDVATLATAHAGTLEQVSFTVEINRTVVINGTVGRRLTTVQRAGPRVFRFRARVVKPFPPPFNGEPNLSAWSDGNRTAVRLTRNGRTSYESYTTNSGVAPTPNSERAIVRILFSDIRVTNITEYEGLGVNAHRIRAVGLNGSNRSVTAVIDTFGQVWQVRVERPLDEDGRDGRIIYEREYSRVGNTTVTRPDWVAKARNASVG